MSAHVFSADDLGAAHHHGIQRQEKGIDGSIQTDSSHGIVAYKIGRKQGGYNTVDGAHHCQQHLDRKQAETESLDHFEIRRKSLHGEHTPVHGCFSVGCYIITAYPFRINPAIRCSSFRYVPGASQTVSTAAVFQIPSHPSSQKTKNQGKCLGFHSRYDYAKLCGGSSDKSVLGAVPKRPETLFRFLIGSQNLHQNMMHIFHTAAAELTGAGCAVGIYIWKIFLF